MAGGVGSAAVDAGRAADATRGEAGSGDAGADEALGAGGAGSP